MCRRTGSPTEYFSRNPSLHHRPPKSEVRSRGLRPGTNGGDFFRPPNPHQPPPSSLPFGVARGTICHTCGGETERVMPSKYCKLQVLLREAEEDGGPWLWYAGAARAREDLPLPSVHVAREPLVEAQRATNKEALRRTVHEEPDVRGHGRDQGLEHTEDNIVFVGNAMRNGHATLAQAQEVMGILTIPTATVYYLACQALAKTLETVS
ncbi:hypothetical protein T492DRAFT_834484 [Pavlovales sp. CCMP2436]|nr:hypothetical protein T492DRAFT_834484 [Pavlovales sp. CCMP2436]